MAELVAILATTHHPFFYATSKLPPEQAPPFAAEWVRKVEAYRETLTRARPDVLVMVGSDHFHQLWLDNMPQFLVGKAPFYDANYYNEEREFGLPRLLLRGHEELSAYILRGGHRRRLRPGVLQRAAGRPLHHVPDLHGPAGQRPAGGAGLHQHLRAAAAPARAVRRSSAGRCGRSSTPGPATCGSRSSAPATCRWSWAGRGSSASTGPIRSSTPGPCEWIADGDIDGCLANVTLDSLHAPGNATHGFMDFMLMMGVAGDSKADYVDSLDLFHTMEAYFTWYPNGAGR